MAFECALQAWRDHEPELRAFLAGRLADGNSVDDFLQEIFLKAMLAGHDFCELQNPRSWLFRVTRNALTDSHRRRKHWVPVPEELPDPGMAPRDPVAELDTCIRRVLPEMEEADRDILEACDLGTLTREEYARSRGLSLPAAKARNRRARERLREALAERCHVVRDDSGRICCHQSVSGISPCAS
ncbi:MAG: sigma-70 family RNA polymerase sigma factor [Pseudomonadota bacterium]